MLRRTLRIAARILRWGVALVVLASVVLWLVVAVRPFPTELLEHERFESTRVRDRHGRLLREALSDAQGRATWVEPGSAMSSWVPLAFVAIEDHRFRGHLGVDPIGVLRAARDNLLAGRIVAGGSTLTQQLVGLLVPGPRTFAHKAREAVLALRLERGLGKDDILAQYVNRAPFGHGAFGIESAARLYLGKPAGALTLAESAMLAGIPRAPSLNNPFTDEARSRWRARQVLDRMRSLALIDDAQWQQAIAEPVSIADRGRRFAAPHFTTFVLAQAGLSDTPGPTGELVTTLDAVLQAQVEDSVALVLPTLADKNVTQAAVVVLDNATGDVLAWVGSRDFSDAREGQVDMVLGERQPGSTLKPFLYGLALERGETAASRLPDFPLFFETMTGDYRPQNYDRQFHGWVRLRSALACSYNVPAVYLANELGVGALHERLRALGFDSLREAPGHYGLGLALGNGEVRLLELTNAYRALANDGVFQPVRFRAEDARSAGRRVMPAGVARLLTDILSDRVARAPAFGRPNALELPTPTAAKTGTSTDFTDNWTVGYSTSVTVGVWVGNFDGRPMEGVSGITGAGRLWNQVMRTVSVRRPGVTFSREGLVEASLCADGVATTGGPGSLRPPRPCEHFMIERFVPGTAPRPALDAQSTDPAAASPRLVVVYPDDGDVFGLSPDVPGEHARVRFRAERTDRAPLGDSPLVWEIDGARSTTGPSANGSYFWGATAGRHRARVWPTEAPELSSPEVSFEVLPAAP